MKKQIGVIFGGKSDEYEVTLSSVANVLRALDTDKYDIIKIGMTKAGAWYVTGADIETIESGEWVNGKDKMRCALPADPSYGGLLVFGDDGKTSLVKLDCIVPVLHGDHGEDGEIQGLFQMAEIPYVGSGVKASANCMDKSATKQIAKLTGVRMADHYLVRIANFRKDPEGEVQRALDELGGYLPMFVKPSSAGSSVGVTKVYSPESLGDAIEEALKFDHKVLVEKAITGREFEVAVLGNLEPVASSVGEIKAAAEFYDYDAKYNNPEIQTSIVEDLSLEEIEEIKNYAVKLYKVLDCRGLARVDFFYSDVEINGSRVVFNEINTLPGFTNISMYPMLWRHDGLATPELMDKLIELAFDEWRK